MGNWEWGMGNGEWGIKLYTKLGLTASKRMDKVPLIYKALRLI